MSAPPQAVSSHIPLAVVDVSYTTAGDDDEDLVLDGSVDPLFSWIVPIQSQLVHFAFAVFFILIVGTIVQNLVRVDENLTDDNGKPIADDDYVPQPNTP